MRLKITALVFSLFFIACKNNENIFSNQKYTDLQFESSDIDTYFKSNKVPEEVQEQVRAFYKNRQLQFAWFNKVGMTQAVPTFYNQLQNYSSDFKDQSFRSKKLDTIFSIVKTDALEFEINDDQKKNLELFLTTTFFKYSEKVYGGITKNTHELEWFIPRNKKNYQPYLDSLIGTTATQKLQEPVNIYYSKLREKLSTYRAIQKKGGFPTIPATLKPLIIKDIDSSILKIKQRLYLTEDLKSNDSTNVFDENLKKAVSSFQARVGLPENGKVDDKTLLELNKSVDFRIKQMMINLERLRWIPIEIENDYILVNIPEYKLHVFEDKKLLWETNVVVGKAAKQTTIFKGNISNVVLNPYWNIPNSIINNEILPSLKRNSSYLSRNNMEVLSGNKVIDANSVNWDKYTKNVPFTIRQKPGISNSLGKIKFLFPNSYSIYLHDTPSKGLFERNQRDFSHGCIRVDNPRKLVSYILRKDKAWKEEKITKLLDKNKEYGIRIKPTVPVYIAYFTAWVDNDGNLNFRNDVYDLDKKLEKEIFVN